MKDTAKCGGPLLGGELGSAGGHLSCQQPLPDSQLPRKWRRFVGGKLRRMTHSPACPCSPLQLFYDPDGSGLRKAVLVYFSDYWNKLDVCAILLFIAGLTCR